MVRTQDTPRVVQPTDDSRHRCVRHIEGTIPDVPRHMIRTHRRKKRFVWLVDVYLARKWPGAERELNGNDTKVSRRARPRARRPLTREHSTPFRGSGVSLDLSTTSSDAHVSRTALPGPRQADSEARRCAGAALRVQAREGRARNLARRAERPARRRCLRPSMTARYPVIATLTLSCSALLSESQFFPQRTSVFHGYGCV